MTHKEALREIERQEKRFAAAKSSRGAMLAKSARDYLAVLKEAEKKFAEVAAKYTAAKNSLAKLEAAVKAAEAVAKAKAAEAVKYRSQMVGLRKTIKNGDRLKCKENVARLRFTEKVALLKKMPAE